MRAPGNNLRFTTDDMPGWHRVANGKGFSYVNHRGALIRDPRSLTRIMQLAIPPAYTDVWICPDPRGHLQATGRDAKGRKQYRYHTSWQAQRKQQKFDRLVEFSRKLPAIRRRVRRDLAREGTPLESVVAAVVRLLDATALRVGNDEYSKTNGSYGLTTLRDRHVKLRAGRIQLEFKGKSGMRQQKEITDDRVARIVRRCQELPGQRLFQFTDAHGAVHHVRSEHVNDYIRATCGDGFTAKDFRTWHASVLALHLAMQETPSASLRPTLVQIVKQVAAHLGNTSAVCRKHYIHPDVLDICQQQEQQAVALQYTDVPATGLLAAERLLQAVLMRRAPLRRTG